MRGTIAILLALILWVGCAAAEKATVSLDRTETVTLWLGDKITLQASLSP